VVPLSRKCGLLEWCEGTQPIGDYLVGQASVRGSGAHSRFRPKDWHYSDCRKQVNEANATPDPDVKYAIFMKVCKNFQPVFRFFFMENFVEPAQWFQARIAYTRSVATNSIGKVLCFSGQNFAPFYFYPISFIIFIFVPSTSTCSFLKKGYQLEN
jgi:ataxia telangiectasia mutated family protein